MRPERSEKATMKVKLDGKIDGELITNKNWARFISTDMQTRFLVTSPEISICGEEDGYCIWVCGLEDKGEKMFKRVDYSFYPITT